MVGEDPQAERYAQLATELGLSKGQGGIEATVAMRRGRWDEARRLLLTQEELPPELRDKIGVFVDALADPAKRPSVTAELRQARPEDRDAEDADALSPAGAVRRGLFDHEPEP